MIPQTFQDWKNCIINDCKIDLTKEFAKKRLFVYTDLNLQETQKFIALYGEQHHKNVIDWFSQVSEISNMR